jgi:hypothetical protein
MIEDIPKLHYVFKNILEETLIITFLPLTKNSICIDLNYVDENNNLITICRYETNIIIHYPLNVKELIRIIRIKRRANKKICVLNEKYGVKLIGDDLYCNNLICRQE